jgi:hypothetical protein
MTEIFRKNENSTLFIPEHAKDSAVDVKKMLELFKEMFDEGVKQNVFKSNYSATEYLSTIASIIIGNVMQLLLLPKQYRALAHTPSADVIMSLVVKEDANIEKC